VRRRLVINLLLSGLACMFAMGLVEGVLRLAGHRILKEAEFLAIGTVFNLDDPLVGFSLAPGSSRIVVKGGAFLMTERINGQGLRDIEHPLVKPAGRKRILVLGDSFMYGDGVAMEETLPRRLGDLMPGADVINAGVRAYDLGQEYLYYKERGRLLQPDLVLLAFFINDLSPDPSMRSVNEADGLPIRYTRAPEPTGRAERDAPRGLGGFISSSLRSRSMLYVLLRKRLDDLRIGSRPARTNARTDNAAGVFYLPAFHAEPADGSVPHDWRRAHRILDEMKRLTGGNGSRLAVIMIPAPWQITEDRWRRWVEWLGVEPASLSRMRPQEMVSRWCASSNTPCLDLLETLAGHDTSDLYFRNDHHWTPEGHRVAAEELAAFLGRNRLP